MEHTQFWYLRGVALLTKLPGEALAALREGARLERWGHRAKVHRGSASADISVILRGGVTARAPSGDVVVRLREGDLFGFSPATHARSESAVWAADETTLAVTNQEVFRQIVEPYFDRLQTRAGLFGRRRELWVPLEPLLFAPSRERMARVLLHLVEREGEARAGAVQMPLRLRPRELADLAGVDPRKVREILAFFERAKLVELGRGYTRVLSLDDLRAVAGEVAW